MYFMCSSLYYEMIVIFTDTFGDERKKCLQKRITTEKNQASHADNNRRSRGDLNTTVD